MVAEASSLPWKISSVDGGVGEALERVRSHVSVGTARSAFDAKVRCEAQHFLAQVLPFHAPLSAFRVLFSGEVSKTLLYAFSPLSVLSRGPRQSKDGKWVYARIPVF